MPSPTGTSRVDRIATLIHQELSTALLTDAKDPRARAINITSVKVTRDLGIAKVYYLALDLPDGTQKARAERHKKETQRALERMSSYLRRLIGERLRLRTVPALRFYWDDAIEHGRHMERVFSELAQEAPAPGDPDDADATAADATRDDSRDDAIDDAIDDSSDDAIDDSIEDAIDDSIDDAP